jgi:hypothetical protein
MIILKNVIIFFFAFSQINQKIYQNSAKIAKAFQFQSKAMIKNPFLKKKIFDQKFDSEIFKLAKIYFLLYFQPLCVNNV